MAQKAGVEPKKSFTLYFRAGQVKAKKQPGPAKGLRLFSFLNKKKSAVAKETDEDEIPAYRSSTLRLGLEEQAG